MRVLLRAVARRRIASVSRARAAGVRAVRFLLRIALVTLVLGGPAVAAELKPWQGGAAPPLALKDLEGRAHRLSDYRGKVVLINFWATWCEPCRDEMPSIQRLRDRMAGKPFAVLAVNVGEFEVRIEDFFRKYQLDLTVLRDHSSEVMKAWRVRELPATFIVARDGRIRYSLSGEFDWADEKVVKLMTGLTAAR